MSDLETAQLIVDTIAREREQAVSWLRDALGCLMLSSPIPHEMRVVADTMRVVADFQARSHRVELEGYDLTHTVRRVQFSYTTEHGMCARSQGNGDFPVCSLQFKGRPVVAGKDTPVFREDEYLMRAGIILHVQSDDADVLIRNSPAKEVPQIDMDFNEESGFHLSIGKQPLSDLIKRIVVAANFQTRRVAISNLGLKWT